MTGVQTCALPILKYFKGPDRVQAEDILRKARGNMDELVCFLEWDATQYLPSDWKKGRTVECKLKFLNTLREKDFWDIEADVLQDCCINALEYASRIPEEIFFPYLICPRVSNEMLTSCRRKLTKCLDKSMKEEIQKDPASLWERIEEKVRSLPEQEYEDLITSPLNCLKAGIGSRHSKEVLCVNIYRSLGIPARLNPFDGRMEYYAGGRFLPVKNGAECRMEHTKESSADSCLTLCESECLKISDWAYYSLERFEEGSFRRLWPHQELYRIKEGQLDLLLCPGIYRVIVTNRQKNGDQPAKMFVFEMERGKHRKIVLSQREIQEEKESDIKVEEFMLRTLSGEERGLTSLLNREDRKSLLFIWLETGREPTEHILNELYEKREEFLKLNNPMYLVVRKPEDMENATFRRVMDGVPKFIILLDSDEEIAGVLAEKVGEEKGKFPLALILNYERKCLYSSAGYNVGLADALLKWL